MTFTTRTGRPGDVEAILSFLPRLADYPLPRHRTPDMFWSSDAKLLERWASGDAAALQTTIVRVGVDHEDQAVAAAIVTMNDDHFSGESNGHLEVVVVSEAADGQGLGRTLIREMEAEAAARGAKTLSLHVIGNNTRARYVYEQLGYDEEMIRAVKHLGVATVES